MNCLTKVSFLGALAAAVEFEKQAVTEAVGGDDASLHCLDNTGFCQRTREFKIDMDTVASYLSYNVLPDSVVFDNETSTVTAKLEMGCDQTGYLARELELQMQFYENGIMRTLIDTADHTRFRISQEDLPVVWDQLEPLDHMVMRLDTYEDHLKIKGITREDSDDVYEYIIGFKPLSIA